MDMTEVLQPAAAAAVPAAGVEVIAQPDVSAFSALPNAEATAEANAAYAAAAAASDGSVLLTIPPAPAVSAVVAEPGSYPVVAAASSQLTAREPPPPYTDEEAALAAEARRLAEAEGLELIRSTDSMSGFLGVCRSGSSSKPYVSKLWTEGKLKHLGRYPTAEEASLAYARALGVDGVKAHSGQPSRPPKQPTMTAEQALAQAEQEGLELERSESSTTGFKGVSHHLSSSKVKPYQARLMRGGKTRHLGNFATAEEAALAHARALAGNEEDLPVPKKRPPREGGQGQGGAARKRKKKGDDEAYGGGGLLEGGEAVGEAVAVAVDGDVNPSLMPPLAVAGVAAVEAVAAAAQGAGMPPPNVYVPVPVAAPPAVEYAAADAGYDAAGGLAHLAMPGAPTYTAAPLDGGVLGGAQPLM